MKGPCFEKAMEHLVNLGIRVVSRSLAADTLGAKLRRTILEPFQNLPVEDNFNAKGVTRSLSKSRASSTGQQTADLGTLSLKVAPAVISYTELNIIADPQTGTTSNGSQETLFDIWATGATGQFEDSGTIIAPSFNMQLEGTSSSTWGNTFDYETLSSVQDYTTVDISNFGIFQSQLDLPNFSQSISGAT